MEPIHVVTGMFHLPPINKRKEHPKISQRRLMTVCFFSVLFMIRELKGIKIIFYSKNTDGFIAVKDKSLQRAYLVVRVYFEEFELYHHCLIIISFSPSATSHTLFIHQNLLDKRLQFS